MVQNEQINFVSTSSSSINKNNMLDEEKFVQKNEPREAVY